MSCHSSDSSWIAIVSDPKPSSQIAVGIFIDKCKAPYEVGVEPTNDGYEPSAITNLAIRSLLLVPFIKVADRSTTSQPSATWISHGQLQPLSGKCIIRVGLEPTTPRFLVSYSTIWTTGWCIYKTPSWSLHVGDLTQLWPDPKSGAP